MLKALQAMLRVADTEAKTLQADLIKHNGTSKADTYATALLVALNIRDILHAGVNAVIDDEVETSIEEYRREHGFNPEDLKGLPVMRESEVKPVYLTESEAAMIATELRRDDDDARKAPPEYLALADRIESLFREP